MLEDNIQLAYKRVIQSSGIPRDGWFNGIGATNLLDNTLGNGQSIYQFAFVPQLCLSLLKKFVRIESSVFKCEKKLYLEVLSRQLPRRDMLICAPTFERVMVSMRRVLEQLVVHRHQVFRYTCVCFNNAFRNMFRTTCRISLSPPKDINVKSPCIGWHP